MSLAIAIDIDSFSFGSASGSERGVRVVAFDLHTLSISHLLYILTPGTEPLSLPLESLIPSISGVTVETPDLHARVDPDVFPGDHAFLRVTSPRGDSTGSILLEPGGGVGRETWVTRFPEPQDDMTVSAHEFIARRVMTSSCRRGGLNERLQALVIDGASRRVMATRTMDRLATERSWTTRERGLVGEIATSLMFDGFGATSFRSQTRSNHGFDGIYQFLGAVFLTETRNREQSQSASSSHAECFSRQRLRDRLARLKRMAEDDDDAWGATYHVISEGLGEESVWYTLMHRILVSGRSQFCIKDGLDGTEIEAWEDGDDGESEGGEASHARQGESEDESSASPGASPSPGSSPGASASPSALSARQVTALRRAREQFSTDEEFLEAAMGIVSIGEK